MQTRQIKQEREIIENEMEEFKEKLDQEIEARRRTVMTLPKEAPSVAKFKNLAQLLQH